MTSSQHMSASIFLYQSPAMPPSPPTYPHTAPSPIHYYSTRPQMALPHLTVSAPSHTLPKAGVYRGDPHRTHSWSKLHFHVCQALTYFPARPKQVTLVMIQQELAYFFQVILNLLIFFKSSWTWDITQNCGFMELRAAGSTKPSSPTPTLLFCRCRICVLENGSTLTKNQPPNLPND